MTTNYPTLKNAVTLLFRLLALIFGLCIPVFIFAHLSTTNAENKTATTVYISTMLVLAQIMIIAYGIHRKKKQEEFKLGKELSYVPFSFLPLAILGTFALFFLIDPLEQLLPLPHSFQEFFVNLLSLKGYSFLIIVILAPLVEEILFRGIILKSFLNKYSPLQSILLTAFLFGAIHFNINQLVSGLLAGVFLGYLYWQTQSLSLCILSHMIYNGIAYAAYFLLNNGFNIESTIANTKLYLSLYFIAALTLAGCLLIIHKRSLQQDSSPRETSFTTSPTQKPS
ncbi:type II CAAX endopeptidase family protein [uncultured Sunxiuqinia sp.]|uniref:CPBP family intramembrane glutamic endopeptidase n=1 Tax=uncultured Sunxiuqinia sp. TaxID=1573825 RepID=UPI00261AE68D|nr:type II CAAX endopeptidase family protein [uncultured Sunxiuqinia sp.]